MFSFSSKFKKVVILSLVFLVIFSSISFVPNVKKVEASGYPTFDYAVWLQRAQQFAVETARWVKDNALKIIMAEALRQMTQAIVTWIDSGFKGNPAFVTDTRKFLLDTADITIGDMLMGTDLNFLCDPFKLQVKLALGLQYSPFKDQIQCSFTSAAGNVTDAYNDFVGGDFIGGGGWDSWLQITTVPQNNQLGAMLIAQSELDTRLSGNKELQLAEANWGGGFLSYKECKPRNVATGDTTGDNSEYIEGTGGTDFNTGDGVPGGSTTLDQTGRFGSYSGTNTTQNNRLGRVNYYNDKGDIVGTIQENQDCTIQTPGSVISNKINWADSSDIRKTELANDVNAIINALVNQLVKNLSEGLLKRGTGKANSSTARADNISYLGSIQSQLDALNTVNTGSFGGGSANTANNNYTDPAYAQKSNALNLIDSMLSIQTQFLANQSDVYNLLNATEQAFASANCTSAEENLIETNVIDQIRGDYTGLKNLSWNKIDISLATTNANSSISALNNNKNIINSTSNESIISQAVQSLSSLTLYNQAYTDSFTGSGLEINKIKNWIRSAKQSYGSSSSCNVNTSALSSWGI